MPSKNFLNNAEYGKNNWWRYILTSFASWLGPFIFLIIISIPIIIFSYPLNEGIDPQKVVNNIDPFVLLLFFGAYYVLSFLIFYICVRFIHHKKLINFINTTSKVKWKKIIKGTGLWFALMGIVLLIEAILYPSLVKVSLNPAFFTLLIISIIIYSIQASFEEIFFRGYLMQGIGLISRKPVIPLIITSALFAIGHFFNGSDASTGVGIVINMFIFGITLGIITLGENGLETAMGVHIANNIFLTTIINSTGTFEGLPSLLNTGTESALIIPSFVLMPILLFIVFRNKWNKLESITQKRYELDELRRSDQLTCVNCKTINPGVALYCRECGEKITVYYASTLQKTTAFIIDIILLVFLVGILLIGIISVYMIANHGKYNTEMLAVIWITLSIMIFFLYFILFEKTGQTIGKKIMKIKVVDEINQNPINFRQSIIRTFLLIIDLIPYPVPGLLGIIFSAKSPKKQRIGDLVAGTLIIKKQ